MLSTITFPSASRRLPADRQTDRQTDLDLDLDLRLFRAQHSKERREAVRTNDIDMHDKVLALRDFRSAGRVS